MTPLLSKSKFAWELQCSKLLCNAFHGNHPIPEAGASQQSAFEQGRKVGALARRLFPDGIKSVSAVVDVEENKLTTGALAKRLPLLKLPSQPAMAIARLIFSIRPDEKWEIVEVKSSIGVKDVHLYDLAFQLFVLTTAGLKIRRCVLVRINSDFIKNGEIDRRNSSPWKMSPIKLWH